MQGSAPKTQNVIEKTSSDPWSGAQPAMSAALSGAMSQFSSGMPAYYPGSTAGLNGIRSNAAMAPNLANAQLGAFGRAMNQGRLPGELNVQRQAQGGANNPFTGFFAGQTTGVNPFLNPVAQAGGAATDTSALSAFAGPGAPSNGAASAYAPFASGAASNPFLGQIAGLAGQHSDTSALAPFAATGGANPIAGSFSSGAGANPFLGQIAGLAGQHSDTSGFAPFSANGGTNPIAGSLSAAAREAVSGPGMSALGAIAGGGANPFLDATFQQGANQIRNQLDTAFARAGRSFNNGSYADAFGRSLGDFATNLYGGAYDADASRRLGAAGTLAGFEQGDADRLQSALGTEAQLGESALGRQFGAAQSIADLSGGDLSRQAGVLGQAGGLSEDSMQRLLSALGSEASLGENLLNRKLGAAQSIADLSGADLSRSAGILGQAGGLSESGFDRQLGAIGAQAGLDEQSLGRWFDAAQGLTASSSSDLARALQAGGMGADIFNTTRAANLGAGQTGASLYNNDISNSLNAYLALANQRNAQTGLSLTAANSLPGVYDFANQGARDLMGVGSTTEGYDQALINADMDRYNYGANSGRANVEWLNAIAQGLGQLGGTTSRSSQVPYQQSNPFLGALGGASAGAGIASALGTGAGSSMGIMGIASLLGMLSAFVAPLGEFDMVDYRGLFA